MMLAFAASLFAALPAIDSATLAAELAPIIASHKGDIAVSVRYLPIGSVYGHNADTVMPTASLIKLSILTDLYAQAAEGKLKLDDKLTLTKDDCVPGSGVITDNISPGAVLTVLDCARLMITVSDNTATNLVLGKTTIAAPCARMKAMGFPETRINAQVFKGSKTSIDPERTKKYGLGSTTAAETTGLLAKLARGEAVGPGADKEILAILRKNQDDASLARDLPNGVTLAHKTGAVNAARTDAGLMYFRGKPVVAICVLTDNNADRRWVNGNAAQVVLGKVGRAVHDHYAPLYPAKAPPKK